MQPISLKPDRQASLRGAWETLEALVDEGKIRHIGVSNYNQAELEALLSYARVKPVVNQVELHPRLPQTALVDFCQARGVGVTAYAPLGRARSRLLEEPAVAQLAQAHGVSPAAVLLRWNVQRGVSVIPKSVTPSRIAANCHEPLSFALAADELAQLDALAVRPARCCDPPWSTFENRSYTSWAAGWALGAIGTVVFSVIGINVTNM